MRLPTPQAGPSHMSSESSSSEDELMQQRVQPMTGTSSRSSPAGRAEQVEPDIESSRNTKPIIDYTSQVKTEPGSSILGRELSEEESEEEEEEESPEELARQRQDDDNKQSSTLVML